MPGRLRSVAGHTPGNHGTPKPLAAQIPRGSKTERLADSACSEALGPQLRRRAPPAASISGHDLLYAVDVSRQYDPLLFRIKLIMCLPVHGDALNRLGLRMPQADVDRLRT